MVFPANASVNKHFLFPFVCVSASASLVLVLSLVLWLVLRCLVCGGVCVSLLCVDCVLCSVTVTCFVLCLRRVCACFFCFHVQRLSDRTEKRWEGGMCVEKREHVGEEVMEVDGGGEAGGGGGWCVWKGVLEWAG